AGLSSDGVRGAARGEARMEAVRTVVGLISGTSMDGIDSALIDTDGERVARRGPFLTLPYPEPLRRRLLELAADPDRAAGAGLEAIETEVTLCNAAAVEALITRAGRPCIDLIGIHGQTILHRPERRFTRQLGDGALLAERLGIPCVSDFRSADVAAGGQGAPLAPLYHAALAQAPDGAGSGTRAAPLAVLNLGGVGNITFVDGDTII